MKAKQEIIKRIQELSGRYSPYNIFSDWIECSALAIQNACTMPHTDLWEAREKEYLDVMNRYNEKERFAIRGLFFLLVDALEEEMTDVLGEVYMAADLGSKSTGQFFTPFHLSELCAKMALPHWEKEYSEHGTISLNEPSCGGGGMIIAAAKVMRDAGINPQRALNVVAQDLDWKGVYMTYLQLSLLGIRAKVVQGDTLADPYRAGYPPQRILRTPRDMGVLL